MHIGFIGLGIMGRPMAMNLLKAGHQLVVDTHREETTAELVAAGAQRGGRPAEIARQVDLVITMLPNSPQVREVALGADGIIEGAHPAVLEAIRGGLAGSTVLNAKAPMMLAHDFTPGFRIDLHVKDLLNALDTSHEVGVPLPLTAAVLEAMTVLQAGGHGSDDHSGLLRHYETLASTRIGGSPS